MDESSNITKSRINQTKKGHILWFHLCEAQGKVKLLHRGKKGQNSGFLLFKKIRCWLKMGSEWTSWMSRNVFHLDPGSGYTGIYIWGNSSSWVFKPVNFTVSKLCLNNRTRMREWGHGSGVTKIKETAFALEEFIYQAKNTKCKKFLFRTRRLHTYIFYTLFHRTSSCSASHHAHFSQRSLLLGNWTSHTLDEIGEYVEHVALVTKAFICLALWLCHLCPTFLVPITPQMLFAWTFQHLSVKPSMDQAAPPHQSSFFSLISNHFLFWTCIVVCI